MENFKSVHQMEPLVMGTRTYLGHAHNEDNDEDKKKFNKLNAKFYTIVVTHWLFYIFWGHVRLIIWNLLPFSISFTQLLSLIDFFTSFGGMCA